MKKPLLFSLTAIGSLSSIALVIFVFITISAQKNTHSTITSVPEKPIALVFGARVYPDHSLSPILKDRVQAGIDLYNSGKVKKLIFTGDNSEARYDEPTSMKKFAVSSGIPESDIILDYAGFSTYDSCYRAKAIFDVNAAILVTQEFHLPRALYTCRSFGIDAVGFTLSDFEKYPTLRFSLSVREWLATVKAYWMVAVTKPEPKFLGEPIPITDNP